MKFTHFFFAFTLFSCNFNRKVSDTSFQEKVQEKSEAKRSFSKEISSVDSTKYMAQYINCKFIDIIQLGENEKILSSFFEQLDDWMESKDKERRLIDDILFVSINKKIVKDFLSSLKKVATKDINSFEKEFEFNASPKMYKSAKKCKDQIKLIFDEKKCVYSFIVKNSFHVEDFGCSEHDLVYVFSIIENKIKLLNIYRAG